MRNWDKKSLGEVCEIVNGSTPLRTNKDFWENGDFPWFTIDDIREQGRIITDTKQKVTQAALSKLRVLPIDTVLLCCTASVGEYAITKIELTSNQQFNGLVVKDRKKLDPEFLMHYCSTLKDKLLGLSGKTTIDFVAISKLKPLEIPLPSLPEQRRIVSILDECFAAIDKAKANAEQNLKNAKELFESYLQGVFENKGDGWEERVLGDLCLLITKGSSPKWQGIKYVDEPGILFVTSENVGEGKMLLETKKYVEEKFNQKDKKSILKKGDVLTNIVGASIGRTAIYDIDDVANINQAVCILRCNQKLIDNVFLMNLLNSPFLKKILHDNEVNTARANLSLGFFNKLTIPCPSLKEQQTIVRQLDALRAETQKLEAVYQKKIADLEELKKSILQKAFAGELKMENAVTL